ncbi:MAG: hypothetical protein NVS4B12_15420 [Ktedonobacteraceae bacterium]
MNSLQPSTQKKMRRWVQAQLRSNWIEVLAIPIITSIMETQPIFVVLIFASPLFEDGAVGMPFLNEISIILLALGLRWWAIGVHTSIQHGVSENNERLLRILGLLLAAGLVVGTPLLQVRTVLSLIFSSVLVLWFWWRGMHQTAHFDDEQFLSTFRIGFVILLIVLLLAIFYLDSTYSILLVALAQSIPIFFLSGVLALSFTRIALIRRETFRYAPENPAAGSTRNWLLVLTVFWLAVVLAVLALETFSFDAVITAISVLWYGISIVLIWLVTLLAYAITPILYGFYLLLVFLARFFHFGNPPAVPLYPPQRRIPLGHPQAFSPEALAIGRFVLLLIVLIALFFIVRVILRKLRTVRKEHEVEEIREGLSLRSIAQQRREERQKPLPPQAPSLETLDPDSARTHYRALLQAIATNNPILTRRPDETPPEYQTRLLAFAQHVPHQEHATPSEQEILDILTHDYSLERYGGKQLEQSQKGYLRTWVPRLIARLTHP